jgi:hypothetical protein
VIGPTVCRYEHFLSDWYARHCRVLGFDPAVDERPASYRKIWEWAAILQTLEERGMLQHGKRAIGFAVGQEPLPSIFAGHGVSVLASDMPHGEYWEGTGQHANTALFVPEHVSREEFDRLVEFQAVDMTDITSLADGEADFIWSSCAIEHVGSLDLASRFVLDSMRLLKRGGIAVHTTEINCSSNEQTIEAGDNVLFRRRDIEALGDRLRDIRCGMARPDFEMGTHAHDLDYDEEPYFTSGRTHIKLKIGPFVSTSFLIIAHKA